MAVMVQGGLHGCHGAGGAAWLSWCRGGRMAVMVQGVLFGCHRAGRPVEDCSRAEGAALFAQDMAVTAGPTVHG
jgi:hypothetical protein